ncbi:MMB_0454 family protein [Mesoplasma seiffertii]|uniref:MMB_0454 family protein n=1 Tax=Mesoplasma seiffertii TaxID=28224 RepID=UPI00047A1A92|nr:hypothetical protein [Mesoplasma seiffertii]
MYISIERNSRGTLDIEQYALNKLIESTVVSSTSASIANIEVITEIYHDNLLYILIKIKFEGQAPDFIFEEKLISKNVEDIITQTLNIKPRNISVAYGR